jgi:hypothetical protein
MIVDTAVVLALERSVLIQAGKRMTHIKEESPLASIQGVMDIILIVEWTIYSHQRNDPVESREVCGVDSPSKVKAT